MDNRSGYKKPRQKDLHPPRKEDAAFNDENDGVADAMDLNIRNTLPTSSQDENIFISPLNVF